MLGSTVNDKCGVSLHTGTKGFEGEGESDARAAVSLNNDFNRNHRSSTVSACSATSPSSIRSFSVYRLYAPFVKEYFCQICFPVILSLLF